MKRMRLLGMLAATIVLLAVLAANSTKVNAATVASGTCGAEGDNLSWILDDTGTLTISGTGAMYDGWRWETFAPWYDGDSSVKAVVIEEGVTDIGNFAFYTCKGLTTVTIPNSVITIGEYAFYGCKGLTTVTIPDSVTNIGSCAFAFTALQSVTIPNGVTAIGSGAFRNTNLRSVTIPHGVTKIGSYAFNECTGLDSVTIPDSVTQIGSYAFAYTALQSVTIPNSVTKIGDYAFFGTNLRSVTIPHGVTDIDAGVFYNCVNLTTVTIPNSVTSIGNSAFYGCKNLDLITIPDSVTSIGAHAFRKSGLEAVTIPYGVTKIAEYAFENCTGLDAVTIPDSVTSIEYGAFMGCVRLATVTLPNSVTYIGDYAFSCSNLFSITIPNSVTHIGDDAFYYCTNLHSVTYCGTAEQWKEISVGKNNYRLTNAAREYHSFEAATCTKLQTCALCGTTAEDTRLPHRYANGVCTVCGAAQGSLFRIDACRIDLGNALDFQFGVAKAKIPKTNGYYAVIEKEWADGTVTTKLVPGSQWSSAGRYWAIVYDDLAAKEMADNIHVTILHSNGQVSQTYTISVRAYAMAQLTGDNMKFKTMLVDMLHYGAAAQKNFSYNTDDLANSLLTTEQLSWGSAAKAMENKQVEGAFYQGTRLVLESRIQMQVAFSGVKSGMYAVYTYTDHYGVPQSQKVVFEDMIYVSEGVYGVSLDKLVVADARQLVTVTVYTEAGQVYDSAMDSIESYCQRSSASMPLSLDLLRFADSANQYFQK